MVEEVKNALELVDRGLSMLNGTRQDHFSLQQALQIIRAELSKNGEGATMNTKEPNLNKKG